MIDFNEHMLQMKAISYNMTYNSIKRKKLRQENLTEEEQLFLQLRESADKQNISIERDIEKAAFMDQLSQLKKEYEKIKREKVIEEAINKYNSQSFIGKLKYRKFNPKKIDFNRMSTEDIEELYAPLSNKTR